MRWGTPGLDGKAALKVTAKGLSLRPPSLGLTVPVTVQPLTSSGQTTGCWQTTYETAGKNTATDFEAKGR